MKYVDLKASLKTKLENNYLIFGEDRFLCFDALSKIESALQINIKDMNTVSISGDETDAKSIVESASIYPFGDEYRLVVIKNFSPQKNSEELKILQKYLDNPLPSSIVVFFNPDSAETLKSLKNLCQIDCGKIDSKFIYAYILSILKKQEINYEDDAIEKLIIYANSDMSKITNELSKLCAYASDTKLITKSMVEQFVTQDKEFQVFELAEFLAKGDAENAVKLVDSFSYKPGSMFSIISPLLNNYRRALFVSLNSEKSPAELAQLLSVKEYAIKMLKNQIQVFGPKKLKQIVSMITSYDNKIKVGEMKEQNAIKMLIFNILNIRGKNE